MSTRGAALFAAMSVIWGVPYLLISVAVGALDPAVVVFGRTALAAAVLLPVAAARGQLRPVLRHWPWILVFALVEMSVPWLLLTTAEQRLPSSLSGLLVAAVPLFGLGAARLWGDRSRIGWRRWLGLLVGLGGVVLLLGLDVRGTNLGAAGMVLVTAVGYAIGPLIVARKLSGVPALGVNAAAVTAVALGYAPYALVHLPASAPRPGVIASVVVLAFVCTAAAFVLFFALIAELGAARATVITYLNPAVALALGATIGHETVHLSTGAGFGLVLAGSVLATSGRGRPEGQIDQSRDIPSGEPTLTGVTVRQRSVKAPTG